MSHVSSLDLVRKNHIRRTPGDPFPEFRPIWSRRVYRLCLLASGVLVIWTVAWSGPRALTASEREHLQSIIERPAPARQSSGGSQGLSEHQKRSFAARGDFGASGIRAMERQLQSELDGMMAGLRAGMDGEMSRLTAAMALSADDEDGPAARRRLLVKSSAWAAWLPCLVLARARSRSAVARRRRAVAEVWGACRTEWRDAGEEGPKRRFSVHTYGLDRVTGEPRVVRFHSTALDAGLLAAAIDDAGLNVEAMELRG